VKLLPLALTNLPIFFTILDKAIFIADAIAVKMKAVLETHNLPIISRELKL
jgi:hypothetical protein